MVSVVGEGMFGLPLCVVKQKIHVTLVTDLSALLDIVNELPDMN